MSRVLITGASRGIGLALATRFATEGWEVCATARKPESPALARIMDAYPKVFSLALDVRDEVSVTKAFQSLSARWDRMDVLINNAAVFPEEGNEKLEKMNFAWFGEAFDCNVAGVARVTCQSLRLLRKAKPAKIVNISSGAGSIGGKEDSLYYAYSVSKAALNMLTRAMAAEYRDESIGVYAISPGWVRTEMGGSNAPLSPDESAGSLFQTISSLTMTESGSFMGRDGNTRDYHW